MKLWIKTLINHAVLLDTSTVAADALGTSVITEDDNLTKSI